MDDFQVDDLVAQQKAKKKKIDSGSKGDRGEYGVIDLLNARFRHLFDEHRDWGEFSRSAGSGNRWGQVKNLPKHAKDTYSGDLTVPTNFRWVVESKNGYDDVDIFRCFKGKCTELDEFLQQVQDDSDRTGRRPLLVWKKTRQERIAFVKCAHLPRGPASGDTGFSCGYSVELYYKGWVGVPLPELLRAPDGVFFDLPT